MRHWIAMRLLACAKQVTAWAHRIDDDFTGKTLYMPGIPNEDIPPVTTRVLRRDNRPGWWVVKMGTVTTYVRTQYLKTGKVIEVNK